MQAKLMEKISLMALDHWKMQQKSLWATSKMASMIASSY
jgi:hypothetical protein